jgi:hypothetical protein
VAPATPQFTKLVVAGWVWLTVDVENADVSGWVWLLCWWLAVFVLIVIGG